jgi:hypothetical protein
MAVVPACLGHLAGTGARAGIAHADCCNGGGGGCWHCVLGGNRAQQLCNGCSVTSPRTACLQGMLLLCASCQRLPCSAGVSRALQPTARAGTIQDRC